MSIRLHQFKEKAASMFTKLFSLVNDIVIEVDGCNHVGHVSGDSNHLEGNQAWK